ncbi:MAG: DUF4240 domain-containing protein [Hamadaea sp.]|uniref:DUF4240 domain-containing protein n=1 Tax=Hamadaea sp. TaxID=2024425 RepID=UPI0018171AA7|nr:DUF4240 domain-containing protein [Hamadaea sp.]NUR73670.1 DUF4240 domain-containing protein [Hamadaea sp.]NUT24035.1 DUF4240 domain-containing protein [Hamadaea sp.]
MELDEFWGVIDAARSDVGGEAGQDGEALAKALTGRLGNLAAERRTAFGQTFARLSADASRWDLYAAAYLIGGGCDLGGFEDFRFGLIVTGKDWYAKALADPDSLAGQPVVAEAADWDDDSAIFAELVGDAVADACGVELRNQSEPVGEQFDVDDDLVMRGRLPRLAALFLGWPANEGCRC